MKITKHIHWFIIAASLLISLSVIPDSKPARKASGMVAVLFFGYGFAKWHNAEQKIEEEQMHDIRETPLPIEGSVIVSVTTQDGRPEPVTFTDFVYCDPIGPMDRYGSLYMFRDQITHWMPKPEPVLIKSENA